MTCGNCGDGLGWHAWYPIAMATGQRELVWVACADCNDDASKPKPELCACGYTKPFCICKALKRDTN